MHYSCHLTKNRQTISLPLHKRKTIVKKPPLVCEWTLGEVLEPKRELNEKLKEGLHTLHTAQNLNQRGNYKSFHCNDSLSVPQSKSCGLWIGAHTQNHAHMQYHYESQWLPYLQTISSLRFWLHGKRLPHDCVNLTRLYCQFYEQDAGGQNDRAPSNVRGLWRLLVMVQARIQTLIQATCAKRRLTSRKQVFLPLSRAKPAACLGA